MCMVGALMCHYIIVICSALALFSYCKLLPFYDVREIRKVKKKCSGDSGPAYISHIGHALK